MSTLSNNSALSFGVIPVDTSANVNSVTGTANQITASPTSGNVVLSLPSTLVLPSLSTATTQIPSDRSNLIATDLFVNTADLQALQTIPVNVGATGGGTYNAASTGSGCVVTFTAAAGTVTAITLIPVPGTGYLVGDILNMGSTTGNGDCFLRVTGVSAGGVTSLQILYGGTGYVSSGGITTTDGFTHFTAFAITLTGTLTSNATFILPVSNYLNGSRHNVINNNTTGAFTFSIFMSNGAGGTIGNGIVIPQGTNNSTACFIQNDGQNDVWFASQATGSMLVTNPIAASTNVSKAYAYGILGFSDTNIFESYQTSVNGYAQSIYQNTSAGATASTDIVLNNNLGTATTYYCNFGINSSGFTGSGSFNLPNASYMTASNGDLAIGTLTSNSIHFVLNSAVTDNMTLSSTGLQLNTPLMFGSSAIAAAGASQGTATTITTDNTYVTSGTGGVILPTAVVGREISITNRTGSAINVYPASGAAIEALAANTAISLPANVTVTLAAETSTLWWTVAPIVVAGTNITITTSGSGTASIAVSGTVPTATTATNLAGGAAGTIHYNTASSTTTTLAIGTAGQVLAVNSGATAPAWVTPTASGGLVASQTAGVPNVAMGNIFYFGDGSDGNLVASSGTTTMTRDMYYNNVTLTGTASLVTSGYRLFIAGTLTIASSGWTGFIQNNANSGQAANGTNNGTGGAAASQGSSRTWLSTDAATAGGSGTVTNGGVGLTNTATNLYLGGQGGAGGNGGTGNATTAGGAIAVTVPGLGLTMTIRVPQTNCQIATQIMKGGVNGASGSAGGGDATNVGGGGGGAGAGGGGIAIFANIINRTTGGAAGGIAAKGGNGGAGGSPGTSSLGAGGGGGGGAGGGGHVYIVTNSITGSAVTNLIDVSGGAGGAGGTKIGTTATNGTGGNGGNGGVVTIINLGTNTVTVSDGRATAGGAGSGTVGGTAGTYQVTL